MNQVKAGAILNYIIIFLNIALGLLYTPYMLRCLGQNEYGLYSLVSSIIAYLTILDFGFGNAIIRYTAKYRAQNKDIEQWELFGMFIIVYSIIGLVAFICGLVLYFNVDRLFDHTMTTSELSQARTMMLLLTMNLAFTFPLSVFGSIISAYERFVYQKILSIANLLLSTLVIIGLLAIGYKAIALVIVHTIFNFGLLITNYFYATQKLKIKIEFKGINIKLLKQIAQYSFWVFLSAIMDKVYWGTGQFVLGSICGTVAVAIFSVAILLENMYMQFSTSLVSVLLPKITGMVALNKSDKELTNIFIRTGRLQCIVLSLILAGYIVFGKAFINLWAGQEYNTSYYIALIFLVSLFVPLIQNTGTTILQARNQMKFRSLLYCVVALSSLCFQIILAKQFGPLGCAIAIGVALLLGQGLVMNIYYSKRQRLDISLFWKEIFKIIWIPLILSIIGIISWSFINYISIINLVVGILIFCTVYVVLEWRLGLNTYEKSMIINFFNHLKGLRPFSFHTK